MATKVLQVLGKIGPDTNYITPQLYGAWANGIEDDTDAIQKALDHGGVIYFPPGRYKVTRCLRAYTPGKIIMCNPYPRNFASNDTLNNRYSANSEEDKDKYTYGDFPLQSNINVDDDVVAKNHTYGSRIETYSQDGFGMIIGDGVEVDGLYIRAMAGSDGFGTTTKIVHHDDQTYKYRTGGIVLQYDGTKGESCYPARAKLSNIIVENETYTICPEVMFDFFPAEEFGKILDNITIGSSGRTHCTYGFRANVAARDGKEVDENGNAYPKRFQNEDNWANSFRLNNFMINMYARTPIHIIAGGAGTNFWVFENLAIQAVIEKGDNCTYKNMPFPDPFPDENEVTIYDNDKEATWKAQNIISLKNTDNMTFFGSHIWDLASAAIEGDVIYLDGVDNLACYGCGKEFDEAEMILSSKLKDKDNLKINNLDFDVKVDDGNLSFKISDGNVSKYANIPIGSPTTGIVENVGLNKLNIVKDKDTGRGNIIHIDTLNKYYYLINEDKTCTVYKHDADTAVDFNNLNVVQFEDIVGEDQCFIGNILGYCGPSTDKYTILEEATDEAPHWEDNKYYEVTHANANSTRPNGWTLLTSKPYDWDDNYKNYYFKTTNKINNNDAYVPLAYKLKAFSNTNRWLRTYWYGTWYGYRSCFVLDTDNCVKKFSELNGLERTLSPSAGMLIPANIHDYKNEVYNSDLYTYVVSNLIKANSDDIIRCSKRYNENADYHFFTVPHEIFCYDINKKFLGIIDGRGINTIDIPNTEYVRITFKKANINVPDKQNWSWSDTGAIYDSQLMITVNDANNYNYQEYEVTTSEITTQSILENYISPRMFGASANNNEKINDFVAFKTMFDSFDEDVVFDLEGNTYYIEGELVLKNGYTIKNGNLVFGTVESRIYANKANNIKIENLTIDGSDIAQDGIYMDGCTDVVVRDCKISNIKDTDQKASYARGISMYSCIDVSIDNCCIHDITVISTDSNHAARAVYLRRCYNTVVNNCTFEYIVSGKNDDGGGIQFLDYSEEGYEEKISNNVLSNTRISECNQRCVKIQQKGVTLRDCEFINTTNEHSCSKNVVSVYNSNTIIEGCKIDHLSPMCITLGVNNAHTHYCGTVIIRGNHIVNRGQKSQGAILFSSRISLAENIIITDNIFDCTSMTTDPVIHIGGRFKNVVIANNVGCGSYGVSIAALTASVEEETSAFAKVYDGLSVTGNVFTTNRGCVSIAGGVPVTNLTVVGNICFAENPYTASGTKNSVYIADGNAKLLSEFNISNNQLNDDFTDGLRTSGRTVARPKYANVGYVYFDLDLNKPIYCAGTKLVVSDDEKEQEISVWVDALGVEV